MAWEDSGNGNMVMPVGPMYGNNGGGFGDFGNGGWWIILLFLLLGNGWNNGNGYGSGGLYPWMNQSNQMNEGFRDQMLATNIAGIQNGVCGIVPAITQQMQSNVIADLERSFAAQTASTAGMSTLQSQLATCCCENRAATQDLKYTIATEACANRSANAANTQSIIDKLCQLELANKDAQIEAERRENANLRSELMFARGQASQDVQTATIQAGQRALANEVEQYVLPTARPAYVVPNPNCCQQFGYGCGYGS